MRLIDVSLNNLWRRKGRMIFVVVGLSLGIATVVALLGIVETMQTDVAIKLDEYGANILVVPKSNDLSLSYGGVAVASAAYDVKELTMADLERIRTIHNAHNISVAAPKLLGAMRVGEREAIVAGVQFENELRLKQWWRLNGQEPAGPDQALLGARLAEVLHLRPGDTAQVGEHSFKIAGVLSPNGSQDDDILFIDLAAAQRIMGKPQGVSLVEIAALCIECPVEDIVEQISHVLPQARVTALRQAVTLRLETVNQLSRFALAVAVVVLLIGGLVVLTTVSGAVFERRQEIGLFRALGFRRRHIAQIILSEAALMGLLGGVLGWLLGMAGAALLAPQLANVQTAVKWDPALALGAVGGSLFIGLGASLYPALAAARLDPIVALRSL